MNLAVQPRVILGKKTKYLRKEGLIPAELYGRSIKNQHLSISAKDFKKVFKEAGESTVINLVLENKNFPALIYGVNKNPITDEFENVDFYQVRMDEKLKTKIPLEFINESPAVKEKGGILVKAMHEIEVESLPADLPHSLVIDLSSLSDLNQSFYVKNLNLAEWEKRGVKIIIDSESVVATVKPKLTEDQEKALEAQAIPSVETIKVETEEKKAERAATKTAEVPTQQPPSGK
jgi:large subunit ribosomal protein L25